MKKGINMHLQVLIDMPLDEIEKVEFVFADDPIGPTIKQESWPDGKVKRAPESDVLLIPFAAQETYEFDRYIYMDTRITVKKSGDQPITPIIQLYMDNTLFETGEKDSGAC